MTADPIPIACRTSWPPNHGASLLAKTSKAHATTENGPPVNHDLEQVR